MRGAVSRAVHAGRHGLRPVVPVAAALVCVGLACVPARAVAPPGWQPEPARDFSARLTRRVDGTLAHAQLYARADRYRIEHQGGIHTNAGYVTVTIVRLDRQCVWHVLSRRRVVVEAPLTEDDVLPLSVTLRGEVSSVKLGAALIGVREAVLYDVVADRRGRRETYYAWVDESRRVLLKLLSRDRDWSVEYDRVVLSDQPEYFFETPLGYRLIRAAAPRTREE